MIYELSFENLKDKIIFPVNPAELIITVGGMNFTDTQVIKGGEYTCIGDKKLDSISFSSFFPRDYDASYCNYSDLPKPWEAVEKIKSWQVSKKPAKLLITSTNINMYVTIRKFSYREKGGEPGDIYYDIEFKEYNFIQIREVEVEIGGSFISTSNQQTERPEISTKEKTYTVVKGDCLWNIAKKIYENGADYIKILNANSQQIKNASMIYPGQVLIIP